MKNIQSRREFLASAGKIFGGAAMMTIASPLLTAGSSLAENVPEKPAHPFPYVELDPAAAQKAASAEAKVDTARRNFLIGTGLVAAEAVRAQEMRGDGGYAVLVDKQAPDRENPITPPGSKSLRNLTAHCTGCQLCVAACPTQILRPSSDLKMFMQPTMSYENGYCRPECNKCSTVCPTGAINLISVAEKSSVQIGHAVWVKKNCIVVTDDKDCGNCERHCPTKAITMVPLDPSNPKSRKIPTVNESLCIGCGACEHLCPSRPFSAIYVKGYQSHLHN